MSELTNDQLLNLLSKQSLTACVDSRLASDSSLFFAMPGENVDGHEFLAQVIEKGVRNVVISKEYSTPLPSSVGICRVESPLQALQSCARSILASRQSKVIAITGSVGKTTTRSFLVSLLEQRWNVGQNFANYNSQIGLPLSIINHTTGKEDFLVYEMAMSAPDQIANLVTIAPPDLALLLNVSYTHSEGFDSLEDIARAKGEIFSHPKTSLGILNSEVPAFKELAQIGTCRKETFSQSNESADYRLVREQEQLFLYDRKERFEIPLPDLPGEHLLHNLLAAVAVSRALGLDWKAIEQGMKHLSLPERRFETIVKNGITFISDAYNSSLVSVQAALKALPTPSPGSKKIAVLGSMPELGKFSVECHTTLGEFSVDYADKMFCLGEETAPIVDHWNAQGKEAFYFLDKKILVEQLKSEVEEGDVVLLKGANKYNLWEVVEEF